MTLDYPSCNLILEDVKLNQNITLSYLYENITIDNYSHMSENKINISKRKSTLQRILLKTLSMNDSFLKGRKFNVVK